MTSSVLVPLANGFEDIEAVTLTDLLHRAGMSVRRASCQPQLSVEGAHGTRLYADCTISQCTDTQWDLIALPGGMPGAEGLRDCPELITLLKQQRQQQRWLAAICASPAVVLSHHQLLHGARATCYPSFQNSMQDAQYIQEPVVVDQSEKIITSRGPGTAFQFALELIRQLQGDRQADTIAQTAEAHWWHSTP